MYGTSKRAVSDIQGTGRICVLDVELQGVRSFKCSKICAKYVLIKPPSFEALVSVVGGGLEVGGW